MNPALLSPAVENDTSLRLRRIVEESPFVAIRWRLEPGWPVDFVSDNIAQFGYTSEELLSGRFSLLDLVAPEDDRAGPNEVTAAASRSEYQQLEYFLRTKSGTKRLVRFTVKTMRDGNGRPCCEGLMCQVQDSLRREERLRLFEHALQKAHTGVVITDATHPDNPIIFANDSVTRITGYTQDEIIGRNCRFLQREDRNQPGLKVIKSAVDSQRSCDTVVRNYRKDGTPFWNEVRISPVPNASGEITHFVGFQCDITARHEAEAALAQQDQILSSVNRAIETLLTSEDQRDAVPIAIAGIARAAGADHVSVWQQASNCSPRTISLSHSWTSTCVPVPIPAELKNIPWEADHGWPSSDALRNGRPLHGSLDTCTPTERIAMERMGVVSFLCLPIFDSPNHLWGLLTLGSRQRGPSWSPTQVEALLSAARVFGSALQRQQTATALRLSEERFRNLSGVSPIGIFETDAHGRLTYTNSRLHEMFSLTEDDFSSGRWMRCFGRKDFLRIASAWRAAVRSGDAFATEFSLHQMKGQLCWVKVRTTPLHAPDGRIIGYVGTVDDVTTYHLANNALRASEAQYRTLVTSLNEVVFQTDTQGNWLLLNPAWTEITGFQVEESLGSNFLNYVHPDDRERNNRLFAPLIAREKSYCRHEVRYLTKTGENRWIEVFARLTFDDSDAINGTAGTLTDITSRKEAEELRRRQLAAIEAAIDGVGIVSPEGVYSYLNSTHLEMFGYESADQLLGKSWRELYDAKEIAFIESTVFSDVGLRGKWRGTIKARRRNGTLFDQELSLNTIEGGGLVCVCRDITRRKNAEARIEQSLLEKEVMLKEIHHRVKNNMQIVSSLLSLQVEHVEDEATRALFVDSQSRIASMALVHEKLYQSADLGHIDFSDYVRDLTENLVGSQGSKAQNIRLILHTDDLYLGIDTAIPCGLLINELVSNAYKHAFPEGTPGTIQLTFARISPGWLTLDISDTGRGIAETLDLRQTRSLGMQLVHTLVRQLRGTIEIHRQPGARFVLRLQEARTSKPSR